MTRPSRLLIDGQFVDGCAGSPMNRAIISSVAQMATELGKTTVADLLAARWGVTVRDTDHDVEAGQGRSISDIFVDDGEQVFRALERDAVEAALREHDGVLALGGGAVLDPATRATLKAHRVAFLDGPMRYDEAFTFIAYVSQPWDVALRTILETQGLAAVEEPGTGIINPGGNHTYKVVIDYQGGKNKGTSTED